MKELRKKILILGIALSLISIKASSSNNSFLSFRLYRYKILSVVTGKLIQNYHSLANSSRHQLVSNNPPIKNCQSTYTEPNFLVVGGGGSPSNNEIALEKNILYFQRTLKQMGYEPSNAAIFFANGNNGQATIRYLDRLGQEQFKIPKIPHIKAAATPENFQNWIQQIGNQPNKHPLFFYFTGHGIHNHKNSDNNALLLWQENYLTVRELSSLFDKLPLETQIVTMMAQCYAGSFANLIYQGGVPGTSVALQTRCGFFATISTQPSVGCTPEVNEADYKDYSSSFFAGLSGVDRIGQAVPSADYNQDGRVTYSEAHAFAKVDEETTDLPVSTSEVWLQRQVSETNLERILKKPIIELQKIARPEQQYVIDALVKQFNFNFQKSYQENFAQLTSQQMQSDEQQAYQMRLAMEIVNISMEQQIRTGKDKSAIAILDRLIKCEASAWK